MSGKWLKAKRNGITDNGKGKFQASAQVAIKMQLTTRECRNQLFMGLIIRYNHGGDIVIRRNSITFCLEDSMKDDSN